LGDPESINNGVIGRVVFNVLQENLSTIYELGNVFI